MSSDEQALVRNVVSFLVNTTGAGDTSRRLFASANRVAAKQHSNVRPAPLRDRSRSAICAIFARSSRVNKTERSLPSRTSR